MLISTKQKHKSLKSRNEALDLKIRDNEFEVVQKTKYLGVQIDCCLNWREQIKAVSTKVSRAIGFLRHAKSFLPQASLKTLYTGIVEPHFRYCCSVWGCAGSTDTNQLQKLQNRAARIITNSSFDTPSRPLIAVLGWQQGPRYRGVQGGQAPSKIFGCCCSKSLFFYYFSISEYQIGTPPSHVYLVNL